MEEIGRVFPYHHSDFVLNQNHFILKTIIMITILINEGKFTLLISTNYYSYQNSKIKKRSA